MSDEIVLKGGISNIKYIWHNNGDKPCELCDELDGTEYYLAEDIPDKPHPNCNCYIQEIFDEDNEDVCEDSIAIEEMIEEAEESSGEIESMKEDTDTNSDEINSLLDEIQSFSEMVEEARAELIEMIESAEDLAEEIKAYFADLYSPRDIAIIIDSGQEFLYMITEFEASYDIFNDYKEQLQVLKDEGKCEECTDKFYHANANYDCTQRGFFGEVSAMICSILKEIRDLLVKVFGEKQKFIDVWND